jgi:4-amino-4-deoxy-L-arabinose transferase-like glycosyltransferase
MALIKAILSLQTELTSAESYFWMCAQHPALGYFDHPPLTAWMIAGSTALFGDSVLAVRLFTILSGGLMTWFVFLGARRLYGEQVGRLAAFLVGLAPLPWAWGAEALTDSPMLLFWAATLWALAHALGGGSPRWWYAAGAFMGLSMLGKYTGVFLGVGMLLFLLASPDHRHWLGRKEPYLAAVLSLAFFSPAIAWNARNGWESFRYQGVSRFGEHRTTVKAIAEFPYKQLVLVTPFIALWAWGSGLRVIFSWKGSSWQDRFTAAMGMTVLLFFFAIVFIRGGRGHWPVAGYVGTLILAAAVVERGGRWGRWLNFGSIAVLATVYVISPLILSAWPREELEGWHQLSEEVKKLHPDFIVAPDYHHASQMGYLCRPVPAFEFTALGQPSKNFPHWWRGAEVAGRNAVIVFDQSHYPTGLDRIHRCFDRVGDPIPISVGRVKWWRFGLGSERFLLVRAEGFHPPPMGLRGIEPPPD